MKNEFIWGADVEGERTEFKVIVEDGMCLTYEGGELTNRLSYTIPEDKEEMWIDEIIQVWGKRCQFQLDKGVPYLKMDGKWTASDTTMDLRMQKIVKNQKLSALVQCGMGLLMCLICLVIWLATGSLGDKWWFLVIIGSVMGISGILQYRNVKREFEMIS